MHTHDDQEAAFGMLAGLHFTTASKFREGNSGCDNGTHSGYAEKRNPKRKTKTKQARASRKANRKKK